MKKLITLCFALLVLFGRYENVQAQSSCPTYKLFLPLIQNNYNPYPGPNMPILSGVQRTPSQILSNLPPPITQPWEEKYYITSVDLVAKTMMLSIRGSAAQWIPVLPSIASTMGTLQAPNVVPGNWARVQRIRQRYWIVGWDHDPNSFGAGVVGSTLPAPLNWNIYQRGASLNGTWSVVPGAIAYEVWQNLSNSPTGATLAPGGRVGNVLSWDYQLGTSYSQLIINDSGFESATFQYWGKVTNPTFSLWDWSQPPSAGWTIDTTNPHTGSCAAHILAASAFPSNQSVNIFSSKILAVAGYSYTASVWAKSTFSGAGSPTAGFIFAFYDALDNEIGSGGTNIPNNSGVYTQYSDTQVAPANTAYIRIGVWISKSIGAVSGDLYIDDFNILGSYTQPSNLFYAVRALGSFSGQVSPFSSWQQPVQQSLSIGNPASSGKMNPISGNFETYKGDDIKVGATAARIFSYLTFR